MGFLSRSERQRRKALREMRSRQVREMEYPEKAAARARVMDTGELTRWIDNTLYAVGRSVSESSRDSTDPDSAYAYARNAAAEVRVLAALVDEYERRKSGIDKGSISLYG